MPRYTRKDEARDLWFRAEDLLKVAKDIGDDEAIELANCAAGRAATAESEYSAGADYDKTSGGGSSEAWTARRAGRKALAEAWDSFHRATARLDHLRGLSAVED